MLGFGFVLGGEIEVERDRETETEIRERREMILAYIFYWINILF